MKTIYNKIILVDSYEIWETIIYKHIDYNYKTDLVLTFDFKLKRHIEQKNGFVQYVDKFANPQILNSNNKIVYDYFDTWYLDKNDQDLFIYNNFEFGSSLKIHLWEKLTFFSSMFISIQQLKLIRYNEIIVISKFNYIVEILNKLNIDHRFINIDLFIDDKYYYFNINKWMNEQLYNLSLKSKIHNFLINFQGFIFNYLDKFYEIFKINKRISIFFQIYYPTETIYDKLRNDKRIKIYLERFSPKFSLKKIFNERPIPVFKFNKNKILAKNIVENFKQKNEKKLFLNNIDVTDLITKIFLNTLEFVLPDVLDKIDSVNNFFKNKEIKLVVIISNIGLVSSIVEAYAKKNNIPTFLIVNGLFCIDYINESKNATFINCYSESMFNNYFNKQENAFILGDPRMDKYANKDKRIINRDYSNITIGSSAYDLIDLTSYLAIEFDFIFDILKTLEKFNKKINKITIKIRSNGYQHQYKSFIDEFFYNYQIPIILEEEKSIYEILEFTDLYISIYSQTIIEAASICIPTIYYKNDDEILHEPFNKESNLIIAKNMDDLFCDLNDFFENSNKFDQFLNKDSLSKYVGFLDGHNTDRNISFIYDKLFKV